MPGHVMPLAEMENIMLDALVVGVAHAEQDVADAATFLAPKLTDELASTIVAQPPRRYGRIVRGRVHTTEPYAVWQETKDWYKHRVGRSRYMANGLLMSVGKIAERVQEAIRAVA
jgi:hypothetical protein